MDIDNKKVALVHTASYEISALTESVQKLLSALGIQRDFFRGKKVLLKPNLVIAAEPDSAIITHPNLVIAAAQIIKDSGAKEVIIAESSLISADTMQAFKKSGLQKVADAIGIECVDLKKVALTDVKVGDAALLHSIMVPKLLDGYMLVNLPKLKTHIQTKLTCAVKNLKGILSDGTKRRVHFLGLDQAIVDFSLHVKPALNIVDAVIAMEGMGALNGTPVNMNLIFGGVDPYCVDTVAAELIGYKTGDVGYLKIASERGIAPPWIGEVTLTGEDIDGFKRDLEKPSGALPELSMVSFEDAGACSACIHTLTAFTNARKGELTRLGEILDKRGENVTIFLGPNVDKQTLKDVHKPVFFGKCTKAVSDSFTGECGFVPGCPPAMSSDLFEKLIPLYEIDEKKLKGSFFDRLLKKIKHGD